MNSRRFDLPTGRQLEQLADAVGALVRPLAGMAGALTSLGDVTDTRRVTVRILGVPVATIALENKPRR